MIESKVFGSLPDGRAVTMYTISNIHGEYVELLDFGAAIHGIYVKDRSGSLANVILQVGSAEELARFSSEAITIGRVANRIYHGRYFQNGACVQLERNYKGEHFIHGGSGNYAYQFFRVISMAEQSICFGLRDTGMGGFPCEADVTVTFTFDDSCSLRVEYAITPEGDTVFSPTNHAYFNLGDGADAAEQILWMNAATYAPKGTSGMPEGQIRPVENTPLDFRRTRRIRDAFLNCGDFFTAGPKFDENVIIDGSGLRKAVELYSPNTGRGMVVYTDMPSMVLFTPFTAEETDMGEKTYYYKAVCLESQFVSNAVNCPAYKQPWCKNAETTRYCTQYVFYHETMK